jgi:dihydropteroate synthase
MWLFRCSEEPEHDTESGRALAKAIMTFPGMVEMRVVVKRIDAHDAVTELVQLINSVVGVKVSREMRAPVCREMRTPVCRESARREPKWENSENELLVDGAANDR